MKRYLVAAAVLFLSSSAIAGVLYDGSLGTTPVAQGLPYASVPFLDYYTTAGGVTTLDTSADNGIYAGFVTQSVQPLDRTAGYTIRFDIRVASSDFANASRAGFSVIALSSDRKGIELGFHANEIFAQGDSPLFVRVEETAFDTTAALTRYDLEVLGDSYTLKANGITKLTGPLRDYTPFAGPIDPYETPNFLFFGDDTTSARGRTEISYIATAVPEPMAMGLMTLTSTILRRRR
jgi:hypothetical protein